MAQHARNYIETMKTNQNVKYDPITGVISQYGGGSMIKPGSYDRYVPFKNFPEANFLIMAWPLGLLQASCNPFKGERMLKGVNLGEIAQRVLLRVEPELRDFKVTVDTLKYFAEKHKTFESESVGFTYKDLMAIYGDTEGGVIGLNTIPEGAAPDYTLERWQNAIKRILDKPYKSLNDRERMALKMLSISGWDIIQANNGGHKCITNISGLMYFGKAGTHFLKQLQHEFEKELKITIFNELKEKTPTIGPSKDTI